MPKPIPPSEAKSATKLLILIILLLVLLFLALVAGITGYLFLQNRQLRKQAQTEQKTTASTPTDQTATVFEETQLPVTVQGPSFQEILASYCQDITLSPTVSFYGIKLENLPIAIDQSALPINLREQDTIACMIDDQNANKSGSVEIEYGDHRRINLYDQNSVEGGHGGQAFFGSRPVIIKDDGTIKWSMSLNWSEGGCPEPKDMAIVVRGERKLNLITGETIFANTDIQAVDPGDTRLMAVLQTKTKDSTCEPGKKEVMYDGTDELVKERFLSNFDKLASPERERVDQLRKILMAIGPKTVTTTAGSPTVGKTTDSKVTLTQDKALSLAQGQLGTCDCTGRDVALNQTNSNTWTVTVTDNGLNDDSMTAKQIVATVSYQNGNWTWMTNQQLFRCAPARGHQTFSAALCL